MRWLVSIAASGPARKALGLMLTALALALFLLNRRRAGESAGRLAERLDTMETVNDAQRQMLDATARRPADRDAVVKRLRGGRF